MARRIFFTDHSDSPSVELLRKQEYAKASGFALDLNSLNWNPSDDQSYVLAAQDGDQIVATMRGEVIDQLEMIERKLECPWDFPTELKYPVLLLSRAATSSSHRGLGLNMLLRYWFLQMAKQHNIAFILGTFVSESPRERSLEQMGYQFFENKLGWQQSSYRSHRSVKVVALDMKNNGEKALAYCVDELGDQLQTYGNLDLNFTLSKFVRTL
jgi:hypothetical protein